MASPTQWTWVWISSRSWWWTGKPSVLQSMGYKESDTTERLNWTTAGRHCDSLWLQPVLITNPYSVGFSSWPSHLPNSLTSFSPSSTGKGVFIPIPKKGNAKECSNYHTIALISHASEVMLKILQARLQQYMNRELPDVQTGFRKGRGTRDQIANIHWIIKKARGFQKNI